MILTETEMNLNVLAKAADISSRSGICYLKNQNWPSCGKIGCHMLD